MHFQRPMLLSFLASGLALVVQGTAAQSVIPPLPTTGPYPVACTNVEQDLSRVPQGETASLYWRGVASGDTVRYIDALLVVAQPGAHVRPLPHRATASSTTGGPANR